MVEIKSIASICEGHKCSVIVESNGFFMRRNGIIQGRIKHLPGAWCIQLSCSPWFAKAYEQYYEVLEPMSDYEEIINALDELAVQ